MFNLKMGDKIKLKDKLVDESRCGVTPAMYEHAGKVVTVKETFISPWTGQPRFRIEGCTSVFAYEMIEKKIEEPNLKVGDKVRIRKDLIVGNVYNGIIMFDGGMAKDRGKKGIIASITSQGNYRLDNSMFAWSDKMLEKIEGESKMTIEKLREMFPIGTKVVPHSKTPKGYEDDLKNEGNWQHAVEKGQPYLFVNGYDTIDYGQCIMRLGHERNGGGNYFLPEDVTLYEEGLVISEEVQKILDAIKVLRENTQTHVASNKNGIGTVAQWKYQKDTNTFAVVVNVADGDIAFVDLMLNGNKLTLHDKTWNHGMSGGNVISQDVFAWLETLKKPSKKTILQGQIKELEAKLNEMKTEVKGM